MTYPLDPSIVFGFVGNDVENRRVIAVYSPDRPDLKLLKVTSTNPTMIAVSTRPMPADEAKQMKIDGQATLIEVTLKPTGHLGSFAEEVMVETDHPQKSSEGRRSATAAASSSRSWTGIGPRSTSPSRRSRPT